MKMSLGQLMCIST